MTRAPRLIRMEATARMEALEEAARIAENQAIMCRKAMAYWERYKQPVEIERSAALQAEEIARLIRERMQGKAKP